MKAFILFFALLLTPAILAAQSFELSITPSVQSVKLGDAATYSVVIKPLNGYDATVFLSSYNGSITFSNTIPSPPYSNITFTIKPNYQAIGSNTITINGKNGNVESSATCTLNVSTTEQWTEIKIPQQVGLNWTPRTLGKDNNGDICFVNGNNKSIFVNHFKNQKWETDTISNSLDFTSTSIPFVYDKSNTLWFFSSLGIGRYDGKFTTIINSSNSEISGDNINGLFLGKNGYPACYTSSKNRDYTTIEQYDGSTWKIIDSIKFRKTSWGGGGFCIDSSNRVWYSSNGAFIRIQDTTHETMLQYATNQSEQSIHGMICDKDGGVWILYHYPVEYMTVNFKDAVSYFDGVKWTHYPPLKVEARDFFVDDDKKVWIASDVGLHSYDGSSWISFSHNNSLLPIRHYRGDTKIIQDKHKNIWLMIQKEGVQFFVYNPYGLVGIPLAPTAIKEEILSPISGIHLSPNPTSSSLTISGIDGASSMQMVNTLGMVVRSETLGTSATHQVDVSNLPNGMYSIQFHTETGIISKPVVVNR